MFPGGTVGRPPLMTDRYAMEQRQALRVESKSQEPLRTMGRFFPFEPVLQDIETTIPSAGLTTGIPGSLRSARDPQS